MQGAPSGSAAKITSIGQEFAEGAVRPLESLSISLGGSTQAVQFNPKTYYSDGSVRFGVITFTQPDLSPNQVLQGILSVTNTATNNSVVHISSLLNNHTVGVSLQFANGSQQVIDVGAAVQAAISDGSAERWLSGPLASQARVSVPVTGSFRLLVTITAFADGTFSANVGFNNDIAMSSTGGKQTYAADILIDSQPVVSRPMLTQSQYQNWNVTAWGAGGSTATANVQHDPYYLEKIGAIPDFDLSVGADSSKISLYNAEIQESGWGSPLSNNGVTQLMPMTGGRPDIGITTEPNAVWLITQNSVARDFVLGQADASGAAPWNLWDPVHGVWLNTDAYPTIWADDRGGTSDHGSIGLTQALPSDTGWVLDTSHQPDLSYYAFMLTGDERYLDSLNAQASFAVTSTWEAYRGSDELVVGYDQVRASAWNLREINEAAWANPAGSAEGQYFTKIADLNWKWLVQQIPAWTLNQGQAHGQVEGYSWGSRDYSRPWMQDYFAGVAAEAAKHGNQDALTFLKWESNFLVGRFLNEENGFNPRDGIAYTIALGPNSSDGHIRFKTWAEIGAATVTAGMSNDTGYSNSIGDYGILGLNSLANIISLTGSTDAVKAYNWLLSSGAPFTSAADRAQYVQFNITPVPPAGWALAADGTIVAMAIQASPPETITTVDTTAPLNLPAANVPHSSPFEASTTNDLTAPLDLPATNVWHNSPPTEFPAPMTSVPRVALQFVDTGDATLGVVKTFVGEPDISAQMFRFFETNTGVAFLTSSIRETKSLLAIRPDLKYEGHGIGTVQEDAADPNVTSVYRFFNSNDGSHFFTQTATERDQLLVTRPDMILETSSFCEHVNAVDGDTAVYRFWNSNNGSHFFTQDAGEYSSIVANRPDMVAEGIAFYAPTF